MNLKRVFVCTGLIFCASGLGAQIVQGPVKLGSPLVSFQPPTQEFGVDWIRNTAQAHTGIDLAAPKGSKVYSVKEGVVYKVGDLGGSDGGYVVVFNRDGTTNGYLHVNAAVSRRQRVAIGQEIGTIFKDHLHLNQCKQADGCQHGAFPNPTFPNQPKANLTKYYVRPRI